jgi:hypothetical protein
VTPIISPIGTGRRTIPILTFRSGNIPLQYQQTSD